MVGVADARRGYSRVDRPAGIAARLLRGVAAVRFEVQADHSLDPDALVGVEVAAGGEVLGQRPGLVAGPGLEGGDELALVDQAVLQGQQTKEQITLGRDGGHGPGLPEGRRGRRESGPRRRGHAAGCAGSVELSLEGSLHAAPQGPIGPPARSTAPSLRLRARASLGGTANASTGGRNPSAFARVRGQGHSSLLRMFTAAPMTQAVRVERRPSADGPPQRPSKTWRHHPNRLPRCASVRRHRSGMVRSSFDLSDRSS